MNEFEKACDKVDSNRDYNLEQENAIEWLRNNAVATVTFSQGRFISKIEKLAKKFPDEVQIVARNKSSIVAHIPVKFIKIGNPQKRNLTEEQKQELSKRLLGAKTTYHVGKSE